MKWATSKNRNQQGFTLVELLVVIGILGIIMGVTIVAINPALQFQNARNAQRQADVNTLLNGMYEYEASNSGALPPTSSGLSTAGMKIGLAPTQATTSGTGFVNPTLTFNVSSGNTTTSGTILVTSCSNSADNGNYTVTGGTTTTITVSSATGVGSVTGCVISTRLNLCTDLVSTYIADIPLDPSSGTKTGGTGTTCSATSYTSGYSIATNSAGNRYTVSAPSAENSATISVTR